MAMSHGAMLPPASTRQQFKRSFTVPTKIQTTELKSASADGAGDTIETLFIHPSAKVVSFATDSHPVTSRRASGGDSVGTLPWRTPTERTLAVGTLQIYRVPSSVSFLWSGSLLHAILPRSQCWCVDGVSTFVFRVLPNQYYRIELPGETEGDKALAEELKTTLKKVLHYERTACPFERGFTIELPATPPPPSRRTSSYSTEPAKKWKLNGIWRPEDDENWVPTINRPESLRKRGLEESPTRVSPHDQRPEKTMGGYEGPDDPDATPRPRRPPHLAELRSVTAPPKLTLIASPPSKPPPSIADRMAALALMDEVSLAEAKSDTSHGPTTTGLPRLTKTPIALAAAESKSEAPGQLAASLEGSPSFVATLAALAAPHSEMPQQMAESPASPVVPGSCESIVAEPDNAQAETLPSKGPSLTALSLKTANGIFSDNDAAESRFGSWSAISTPSLSSDSEGFSWQDVDRTREATRVKKRRSRESQTALANGIIRKTYGVFLRPPAHLVALMLRIAASIKHGTKGLTIRSPPGSPQKVPGSYTIDNDDDDWDDYGYATQKRDSVQHFPVL